MSVGRGRCGGPSPGPALLGIALAAFVACAGSDHDRAIAGFVERSRPVRCVGLGSSDPWTVVADVVTATDSTFLVLFPLERVVVQYRQDLTAVRTTRFDEHGPLGVRDPQSVAAVGDTLLAVADARGRALRFLHVEGKDRGTIRTDFFPSRVRAGPHGLLVTALDLAFEGESLLHAVTEGTVRPMGVPSRPHRDPRFRALANLLEVAAFPDGRTVVAHRFVDPVAHVLGSDGRWREASLAVPDLVAGRVGWLPETIEDDEALKGIVAPVLAASADPVSEDLVVLTRSGRVRGGVAEKAIARYDRRLEYRRSYLLDVNAGHLAYLPARRTSVVVDEEGRWWGCPTP